MGVCEPIPAVCASTPTCACMNAQHPQITYCAAAPVCFDDGAGHLKLECHYY
jgi:hypothetical protein